jgi:hypothetical protein
MAEMLVITENEGDCTIRNPLAYHLRQLSPELRFIIAKWMARLAAEAFLNEQSPFINITTAKNVWWFAGLQSREIFQHVSSLGGRMRKMVLAAIRTGAFPNPADQHIAAYRKLYNQI